MDARRGAVRRAGASAMTAADLAAIRAAAKDATEGDVSVRAHGPNDWDVWCGDKILGTFYDKADARAYAPAAMLRLLDRIEALTAENARLRELAIELGLEALSDEGPDWSNEGVHRLRQRVAALSDDEVFDRWRDAPAVALGLGGEG